jgi:hypothetical protein
VAKKSNGGAKKLGGRTTNRDRSHRADGTKKHVKVDYPFDTVEEFRQLVLDYFDSSKRPTLTGLALHLGFKSRASFLGFKGTHFGAQFTDEIEWARLMIENEYEMRLADQNYGGAIFALKNMGWSDTKILEANVRVNQITRKVIRPKGKKKD